VGGPKLYVLDTSGIIHARNEQYPPDVFPAFWTRLEDMVDDDRVLAPEDVLLELKKKDDDAYRWLNARKKQIIPQLDDEVQAAGTAILAKFPELTKSGRGTADPWVIALAKVTGGAVVTKERPGTRKQPKIPDACKALRIECCSVLDVIRFEGWTF
jgi:Domain of unknown function (DUF4411)